MDLPITNINNLKSEIERLRGLEQQQSSALANRFSSPSTVFSTVFSLFSGTPGGEHVKSSGFFNQDFVGLISRFVLPLTLNKTLFRNSNFLVKALVGLVSQKASHLITEDSVVGIWDKIKTLFHRKEPDQTPQHNGVPAFSESY